MTGLLDAAVAALGFEDASPLDQGGQKIVLKGTLGGLDAVAKIIPLRGDANDALILKRAHREVELLAAVDSPHVVKVLTDAIEIDDPPVAVCWVEEFLDGEDLRSSLTSSPWPEEDVWALLRDVSIGLNACHELDVVHRDLSPANVRHTESGRFVLMDPGLARHLAKTAITGSFQPGTDGWRSPEHIPGGDPTPASDIFCLGVLAYYALVGEVPIDPTGTQADYVRRLTEGQVAPIATRVPEVSADLGRTVDRCLQRQPGRRFIDGRELHETVTEIRGAVE